MDYGTGYVLCITGVMVVLLFDRSAVLGGGVCVLSAPRKGQCSTKWFIGRVPRRTD